MRAKDANISHSFDSGEVWQRLAAAENRRILDHEAGTVRAGLALNPGRQTSIAIPELALCALRVLVYVSLSCQRRRSS